ncbi:Phage baseplate assembly protein W [Candidatus Regiella insecticola 5.15]|uniref:Phage baseplate assembly protein W n=1 Tax=Candidatus Regiella insecticola 5.15 TaxID=1005043 RepID=G2H0E8_9ENTR|nr:GPW/gp25 family protein [Candidatus Regiella insecticola]EGY28535.1 Phage baseplate assembly protein W [Candidatus Regiella insecticola 5.15]
MVNDQAFLGQGWSFPPTFSQQGAVLELVSGEEDIRQSLRILLSTNLQERVMQPTYGCELSQFLFEEVTQGLIHRLQKIISDAVLYHEPRIRLDEVIIMPHVEDLLLITLNYTLRTTNSRSNLVYPFYLTEATHLLL